MGVGATCVVSASLESFGMTWNQPSPTTLSPALCACADSDAHAATATANGFPAAKSFFISFLFGYRLSCERGPWKTTRCSHEAVLDGLLDGHWVTAQMSRWCNTVSSDRSRRDNRTRRRRR